MATTVIGHLLMYIKILLQEVWRAKVTWDEEVTGTLLDKWRVWLSVLPSIHAVNIPRCYRQVTTDKGSSIELHVFCDASENGMAAIAYFRFEVNGVVVGLEVSYGRHVMRCADIRYILYIEQRRGRSVFTDMSRGGIIHRSNGLFST